MNVNPMNLVGLIQRGYNPQQLMIGILQQNTKNNPLAQNLLSLVQQGDTAGIEQIARNACQERGVDYDKEINNFKNNLGL